MPCIMVSFAIHAAELCCRAALGAVIIFCAVTAFFLFLAMGCAMSIAIAFVALVNVHVWGINLSFVSQTFHDESSREAFVCVILVVHVDNERLVGGWFMLCGSPQCCDPYYFDSTVDVLFFPFLDGAVVVHVE